MSDLDAVIDEINATFQTFTPETPLDTIRKALDDLFRYDNPDSGCTRKSVQIGSLSAELIAAEGVDPKDGAILYLHGGGYAVCSIASHRDLAERLSHAARASVLIIEYRLAPENPFPAALDDALAAYQWLRDQGHDPRSLAIAGDSAGGGLALATLLAIKDRHQPLPACAAVFSPWVDLELKGGTMVSKADVDPIVHIDALRTWIQCYAPDMDVRDPLISPLHGDYRGIPPLLVQVGGREALLDDALRLVEVARAASVEVKYQCWEHQIHVFQTFGSRLADARVAIADAGNFIRDKIDSGAGALNRVD
jgi:acetyl esterase/lipase